MATNNIIELVVKLKDQASAGLSSLGGKLKSFGNIALGLAGVASIGAAVTKTIRASKEAEEALVRFDIAFQNLGKNSRKTREDIIAFADEMSKKSIFDDEKILQAQTALLNFRSVSGKTFDRARQDAIDLASALGTDLTSAAEIVGRAIERPELAIRQLRSAGVVFTKDQEKMIKALAETGERAKAAEIVLGELERRFSGAGDKMANTLTGAFARLQTAWDNLFEVDTGPLTQAVGKLADALNDPDIRSGVQYLLTGFLKLLEYAIKIAAKIGEWGGGILDASANLQVRAATKGDALSGRMSTEGFTAEGELNAELKYQLELIADLEKQYGMFYTRGTERQKQIKEQIEGEKAYTETLRQRIQLLKDGDALRERQRQIDAAADSVIDEIMRGPQDDGSAKRLAEELEKQGRALAAALDPLEKYNQAVAEADSLYRQGAISGETWALALARAREELDEANRAFAELNPAAVATNVSIEQFAETMDRRAARAAWAFARSIELSTALTHDLEVQLGATTEAIEEMTAADRNLFMEGAAERAEMFDGWKDADFENFLADVEQLEIDVTSAFDRMVDAWANALERMLNNGEFSFKELGRYLLREVVSGWIKRAIDEFAKSLKAAADLSAAGGGGGFFGWLGKAAGWLFGGNAGGGDFTGTRWVGEDRPELITRSLGSPMMRAYNMRQLGTMGNAGGGAAQVRGGDVNLTFNGFTEERLAARIEQIVEARVARSERGLHNMLVRQGVARG